MKELKVPSFHQLKATAIEAAHAAGAVHRKHFGRKLKVREKKGEGLVTNADIEAENAAMKILRRDFPSFGILTEESAPDPETSRKMGRWICDPLDGTTNFIHRFPMFCVSIAAEWNNEVVVGVIYHPILDDTYIATKGKGATVNGKRLHVSETRRIHDSLLTTGFTYRKKNWLKIEVEAFERLSALTRAVRRPGSAALDLAYTARGVFDGFWERRLSPWDVAAGALLVQEAGGLVTDFKGSAFHPEQREIIAANPYLHKVLRKVISSNR
ncbi:inositol monophosphatase family protein [Bdellovibrionota bacterium FG-1]